MSETKIYLVVRKNRRQLLAASKEGAFCKDFDIEVDADVERAEMFNSCSKHYVNWVRSQPKMPQVQSVRVVPLEVIEGGQPAAIAF